MAELGAGGGSGYPAVIDIDVTPEIDLVHDARADVPNDLADAIIKVQTELGVNPAGSVADLVTRLAVTLEDSGALKTRQFNNLLKAGGFPSWTIGVDGVTHFPDGWSEENTPTNYKREAADIGYGKYAARLTTNAVNEGIKQTLSGLKGSTTYTIKVRAKATAGDTARLFTTGATVNVDEETALVAWTALEGTFTTDAGGTNVVVKLVGKAATDIVWFCGAVAVEGTLAPVFAEHPNDEHLKAIHWQDSAAADHNYGLLRMECGVAQAVWVNNNLLRKIVTFQTAFRKILIAEVSGGTWAGFTGETLGEAGIDLVNITTLHCNLWGNAIFVGGDTADIYWMAIGVV